MGYLLDFKRNDGAYLRAHLVEKNELEEWVVAVRARASGFFVDQVYFLDEIELKNASKQVFELHRSLGTRLCLKSLVSCIELTFEHDGLGHYQVEIRLHGQFPHKDCLNLAFTIDQTELLLLAEDLSNLVIDPELADS